MVLGGLIGQEKSINAIHKATAEFRQRTGMHSEMKWTRVSRAKLQDYKDFVDIFFQAMSKKWVNFHCVIIDTSEIDHKKYNDSDNEIGFYKFFYQLLLHRFGKTYGLNYDMDVFLDYRDTDYCIEDMTRMLNGGLRKFAINTSPFKRVTSIDSKKADIIQLNDLIIGAIGYHKNGMHARIDAAAHKLEFMEYIARQARCFPLSAQTPRHRDWFTVWMMQFRQGPR